VVGYVRYFPQRLNELLNCGFEVYLKLNVPAIQSTTFEKHLKRTYHLVANKFNIKCDNDQRTGSRDISNEPVGAVT
jgi:hypothetical protein